MSEKLELMNKHTPKILSWRQDITKKFGCQ
jgi:hypothetical protein